MAGRSRQDGDHHHATALALRALPQRAAGEIFVAIAVVLLWRRPPVLVRNLHAEETSALVEFLLPISVPQEAVIANPLEPVRQYVEQEPPDEFVGGQGHRFTLAAIPVIFPLEADLIIIDVQQAVVGNGHAVSIAAHVVEDLLRSGERALGIDHPLKSFRSGQKLSKSEAFPNGLQGGEEPQFARIEGFLLAPA